MKKTTKNPNLEVASLQANIIKLKDPYYLFLFVVFFADSILIYFIGLLNKFSIFQNITPLLAPTILVCSFFVLLRFKNAASQLRAVDFLFIAATIASLLLSILLHPETNEFVMEHYVGRVLLACIPCFIAGILIRNVDETSDFLGRWGGVAVFLGSAYIYYLTKVSGEGISDEDGGYNMGMAYVHLYPELFLIARCFRFRQKLDIVLAIIGFVALISLGTRGPCVLVLLFVLLCAINEGVFASRGGKVVLGALIVVGCLVSFFNQAILEFLGDLFTDYGLSTRVIDSFTENDLLKSSSRAWIREVIWQKILEGPVLGYGIAGEWQFTGWNAHNFYLTALCNYGIVLGTALIVILATLAATALIGNENSNARVMLLMFICLVFVKGIFGSEPLSMETFFLLGFSLNQIRRRRQEKRLGTYGA